MTLEILLQKHQHLTTFSACIQMTNIENGGKRKSEMTQYHKDMLCYSSTENFTGTYGIALTIGHAHLKNVY